MKQVDIDRYRQEWRDEVARLAGTAFYADETRAERFFLEVVAPLWQMTLKLDGVPLEEVAKSLGVTPTMMQMLRFFALAVIGRKPPKWERKAPRFNAWPPYVTAGGLLFVPAVPVNDIALCIGKTASTVKRANDGFRGRKGKAGLSLYDKKLVFPAPFATGIMLDGAFEAQLSFPFAYQLRDYTQIRIYNTDQRRETGHTATLAIDWAKTALGEGVGTPGQVVSLSTRRVGQAAASSS